MSKSSKNSARSKKCYEEIFSSFNDYASDLFSKVPELRSFVLITDWEIGQNDFPYGTIHNRDNSSSLGSIFGCLEQTQKMLLHQVEILRHILIAAKATSDELEKKILEQQKILARKDDGQGVDTT